MKRQYSLSKQSKMKMFSSNEQRIEISVVKSSFTSSNSNNCEHFQSSENAFQHESKLQQQNLSLKCGQLSGQSLEMEQEAQKVGNLQFEYPSDETQTQRDLENIMKSIQSVNFEEEDADRLQSQFCSLVKNHITWQNYYPHALSQKGQKLIQNGLFHEMWGYVMKKCKRKWDFYEVCSSYYQRFVEKVSQNCSNFEEMYNNVSSMGESMENHSIDQYKSESQTRTRTQPISLINFRKENSQTQGKLSIQNIILLEKTQENVPSCSFSSKQNIQPSLCQQKLLKDHRKSYSISPNSKRLRLTQQKQVNHKRVAAEMAIVFLKIKRVFVMEQIEIVKVLQFYKNQHFELAIILGCVLEYNDVVEKVVMGRESRTLLSVYKFIGFEQLLRLEKTYGNFYGLLVYDQDFQIEKVIRQAGYFQI